MIKKPESIIEYVRIEDPPGALFIEEIDGDTALKRSYYSHKETGQRFSGIDGGIGLAEDNTGKGFAIIIGVEKPETTEPGKYLPVFHALAEAEGKPREVLRKCASLRWEFGYRRCPEILDIWYGDFERYTSLFAEINESLSYEGESPMVISPPFDFSMPQVHEDALQGVLGLLETSGNEPKRFFLDSCSGLRAQVHNMLAEGARLESLPKYPGVLAAIYAVSGLKMLRPWVEYVKPTNPIPTMGEDPESYGYDGQRQASFRERISLGEDSGRINEGRLIDTIWRRNMKRDW